MRFSVGRRVAGGAAGVLVVPLLIGTGLLPEASASVVAKAPVASTTMTTGQALARARATKKPVEVSGATTATDSLVANPDGSLTLTRAALPVRRFVGGAWRG